MAGPMNGNNQTGPVGQQAIPGLPLHYRPEIPPPMQLALEAFLVTDHQGVIHEANHAAVAMLQLPSHYLVGKPLGLLISTRDRTKFYRELIHLNGHSHAPVTLELRLQNPGSSALYLSALVFPGFDDISGEKRFHWLLRNVTSRRDVERALDMERDFTSSLVSTAPVFILTLDDRGIIIRSNPHLWKVTGFEEPNLLGQEWAGLLLPKSQDEARLLQARSA